MFLPVTILWSADILCKQFGLNQAKQNVGPDLNSYFLILMLSLKEFTSKDTYLKSKLSLYNFIFLKNLSNNCELLVNFFYLLSNEIRTLFLSVSLILKELL